MIISTIIRTVMVGYSFFDYSKKIIQSESELIADIIMETTDKTKILNLIKNSKTINDIKFIKEYKNDVVFDIRDKTITSFYPIENDKSIKIIYNGELYFSKLKNATVNLLLIASISLILIILIVNYFLTPYLEILDSVKKSTQHILKGDFNYKLHTRLKGKAGDFINSYNEFLDKLNESFGVIEQKYTSLIEKNPGTNPLYDAKETISQLADIFKFKRVIEEDINETVILDRLAYVIDTFGINNYMLTGIDNNTKKIFYIKQKGDICCSIQDNPALCRAYRSKHEINSKNYKNLCEFHYCKNKYFCIPFSSEGNFTGILKIMYENENISDKIAYIKAYLKETSAIIESKYTLKLLKKQSIKDPLTGLYNRRFLEETLPKIISSANRRHSKVGFLMIDIDHFKKINDTYGHDIGDKVIQTISSVILNSIRESDIAVRFGGEEFLVILNNIHSINDVLRVAEKIRKTIEKTKCPTVKKTIKKTVSIGASLYSDNCQNVSECIKNADLALYKAKNNGRNQVVIFDEKLKEESNY